MLTDDELLDFDASDYADYDESRARKALAEHRDAYRAQLVAARWLDGWRERLAERPSSFSSEEAETAFSDALANIAAYMRQGDLIPGGALHDQEDSENAH